MKLASLRVTNFRSIRNTLEIPITDIHAFIGENNTGKSNLIRAVSILTAAGSAELSGEDFNNPEQPIIIRAKFTRLTDAEKLRWRPYLVSGNLVLEKHFSLEKDERSGKIRVGTEFHGYKSEPTATFLSIAKIEAEAGGGRVNWVDLVTTNSLPEYFLREGRCTKPQYQTGLQRYLGENEVEYDEPNLSATQALGLPSNVVAWLPQIHILKAITDYSREIEKRSTSTIFRKLMADLFERMLQSDPKYLEILNSLKSIHALLNRTPDVPGNRMSSIDLVENTLTVFLRNLMPSVQQVSMAVSLGELKDMFSAGVELKINDGVETGVLLKGDGLQRCLVFSLLHSLIQIERMEPIGSTSSPMTEHKSIILCIEEPELYIHPQLCKLFYDVMVEFSKNDQVIYTTLSPLFIDAYECGNISIVRKVNEVVGTEVRPHDPQKLAGLKDDQVFKCLARLNTTVNEMFFARKVLLVEGPEDEIAVVAVLLEEGKIKNRVEEIGWSIVNTGGKGNIKSFQRILNSFAIPYTVLHDSDLFEGMNPDSRATNEKDNAAILALAGSQPVVMYPTKLERTLGLPPGSHLKDQYAAYKLFLDPNSITNELRGIVDQIFV